MSRRIRSIKPEILDDERTAALSHGAWRLFVSLWLLADDYGNFRAVPRQIGGAVFWGRDDSDAGAWLAELITSGLIQTYTVKGQSYAHISGWHHQKVDKPGKPLCPGPHLADETVATDSRDSRETPATVSNDNRNPPETLAPDRDLDQDPDQEKDQDQDPDRRAPLARASSPASPPGVALAVADPRPLGKPKPVSPHHADIAVAYGHWRQSHPQAAPAIKTTSDGFKKAAARLNEGRTLGDLISAIAGMHATAWYVENNQTAFEMAMRPDKFLMFLENSTAPPRPLTEKDRVVQQLYQRAAAGGPGMFDGV